MLSPSSKPLQISTKDEKCETKTSSVSKISIAFATMLSACTSGASMTIGEFAGAEESDTGEEKDYPEAADSNESIPNVDDTGGSVVDEEEEIVDNIGTWPTDQETTDISAELMEDISSFEPSGVVEYKDGYLLVGDDGDIARIGYDGSMIDYWIIGGDYEGITVDSRGLAYIADEEFTGIREFDAVAGAPTGEFCYLDIPTDVAGGLGIEGITFVPTDYAPASWGTDSNGFFVVGSQYVSDLYVYSADDCNDDANLEHVATIPSTNTDVSGLHFNVDTERLYVLHDAAGTIDMMKSDGTLVNTYTMPTASTTAQEEGIALRVEDCESGFGELVIAYDATQDGSMPVAVTVDSTFPVTCK